MKIRTPNRARQQGTVLLVCMIVAGVIGATLASYLLMTQNQNVAIFRSQNWNNCMPVTEAGLEDGLQLINHYAGSMNDITRWTNFALPPIDNWDQTGLAGNVYHKRGYLDAGSNTFYDVYVTNVPPVLSDDSGPMVTAIATVPWNFRYTDSSLAAAAPQSMFAAVAVNPGTTLTLGRSVAIRTKKDPIWNVAMASSGIIDLMGNGVSTDSFDSGDPYYSINGLYPSSDLSKT